MSLPRTKLLKRTTRNVDARIFLIATEGAKTEPSYFEWLRGVWITNPSRVHIEVVDPGSDNLSAAQHIIERLSARAAELGVQDIDSCWLVFDVDRQPQKSLKQVLQRARQKGYELAVSNPCFELWLLLHVDDPGDAADECKVYEQRLRVTLGGYNKARLPTERFDATSIEAAIQRAKALDVAPAEAWPSKPPATHVYRLIEELRTAQQR